MRKDGEKRDDSAQEITGTANQTPSAIAPPSDLGRLEKCGDFFPKKEIQKIFNAHEEVVETSRGPQTISRLSE